MKQFCHYGIAIMLLFCLYSIAFANEDHDFYITTALGCGFSQGVLGEYVYDNGRKVSQLHWNIDHLYYYFYEVALYYGWFTTGLSLQNSYDHSIGTINDSDWTDNNNPYVKTNFSHHDNYLEYMHNYNVYCGFLVVNNKDFQLIMKAGYIYKNIKMSARDGYVEYPPGSPKVSMYGIGIIYQQEYSIPYIAIEAMYTMYNLSLSGGLSCGIFADADDVDNHVKRDIDFHDDFDGILYLCGKAGIQYSFTHFIIGGKVIYEYVPVTKGDEYYINNSNGSKSPVYNNCGGCKLAVMSIELFISIKVEL
ncbi:MAG TPA: omptin family outer membrane protease [Spirochaetota bacterium]|nr:omptin family outer membrane protease [Spirochaetota bacterium]HOM88159.1 omptin family outer membrane protease [Spirochaetota bacterium]HOR94262.1 omptin family outer membrane protease [Spirochaetota bacterium]HOT19456.1 omptin family outer membrane protease [Spirochaetota bacterium]HPD05126.1 omptin family outer membrane protease [Spirochaetota bacterium]